MKEKPNKDLVTQSDVTPEVAERQVGSGLSRPGWTVFHGLAIGLLVGVAAGFGVAISFHHSPKPTERVSYRDRTHDRDVLVPVLIPMLGSPGDEVSPTSAATGPDAKGLTANPANVSPLPPITGKDKKLGIGPMQPLAGGVQAVKGDSASTIAEIRRFAALQGVGFVGVKQGGGAHTIRFMVSGDKASTFAEQLKIVVGDRGAVSGPYAGTGDDGTGSLAALTKSLTERRAYREQLLVDYLPDAPAVKDVESEIAGLEKEIAGEKGKSKTRPMHVDVVVPDGL